MHKAAAERLLDHHELAGQRSADSALLRYGLPAILPAPVLGHIPVLPLDRRLSIPMVHADDVADVVARVLERRIGGAFNLAAAPPATTRRIADALGARAVHVPSSSPARPAGGQPSNLTKLQAKLRVSLCGA